MWIIMETSSISYTTCFCNDNKQKSRSNITSKVAIYLRRPIFAHGQLYVAASRTTDPSNLMFYVLKGEGVKNLVIKQILD